MKRKVIKQGHNTLTVTLPAKWVESSKIKPGDEIEIVENDDNLLLSSHSIEGMLRRIEVNITGFERCTILFTIRMAYRMGYDEVFIRFDEQLSHRFRDEKKYKTVSFINYEVDRLIGFEVVDQKTNSCLIKDVSSGSEREFDSMLKRMFLVSTDTFDDLLKGIKENDFDLISTIEEKHDIITKFVSYCMRLINKNIPKYSNNKKLEIYHVLASLDNIADIMKYSSRDIIEEKIIVGKKAFFLLEIIGKSLRLYYEIYYKFHHTKIIEFHKERYVLLKGIRANIKQLKPHELLVVNKLANIIEIIDDICKSSVALNLK